MRGEAETPTRRLGVCALTDEATNKELWDMTKIEATQYIAGCGEHDGPSSYDEAAEIFAAIFGRRPDPDDGDAGDLFSHAVAATSDEE